MSVRFFTITVNALLMASTISVAQAKTPATEAALPFTPAFAQAIGGYRDCVLASLGQNGTNKPDAMTVAAMSACADARGAVGRQLAADISAANPAMPVHAAARAAQAGMTKIEPMIAAAALDQAREMAGVAASTSRETLPRPGVIG